jgi:ABC-type lipoprotein release transport system permease subunit
MTPWIIPAVVLGGLLALGLLTGLLWIFGGTRSVDLIVAARSLFQHTKRTLLLGTAIAAVTAFLVLLTGLSTGIRETMFRTATTLMSGDINVGGFYKVTEGQGVPVVVDYPKIEAIIKEAVPELSYETERVRGWAKLVSDTGSLQVQIGGIDIAQEPEFKNVVQLASGNLDELAKPGTILLFENQAKKLEVKVGDALTFTAPTTRGASNTLDVRVVAIGRDLGLLSSWNTYVSAESLRTLYQIAPTATGAIHLHLKPVALARVPAIMERLRQRLAAAGYRMMDPEGQPFFMKFEKVSREDWTGQKLDVTSWEDELAFFSWTLKAVRVISVLLITILLAIVVVGIMNTMWIAIRERTREIGTLRAIGMQREQVVRQFLIEALLLGLGGTLIGAAVGGLVGLAVNAARVPVPLGVKFFLLSDHLFLSVHPSALLASVAAITLITGLAALYPSLRAARLEPVTAMQHF